MRSVPSWDTSVNSFSIRIPPKPFAALKELGGVSIRSIPLGCNYSFKFSDVAANCSEHLLYEHYFWSYLLAVTHFLSKSTTIPA